MLGLSLSLTRAGVARSLSLDNFGPSNPLYIAHRGGSFVYPEETMEGYRASLEAGSLALEGDVAVLADSALGMMHDPTVDRTTTGTGSVATFDTASWQALNIDAGTQMGGGWSDTLHPPLFADFLSEFKNRCILVPEAKSAGSAQPTVDAVVAAGIRKNQVIIQGSTLTAPTAAVNAGLQGMYLTSTSADVASVQSAGIQWVGVDNTAADSVFQDWVAAGVKVTSWTVNRRYDRDRLRGLGVMGFFTDEPQYLAANVPRATSDNFASQKWQPGMLSRYTLLTEADRGRFFAPNYWGWSMNTGTAYVLQGWACPVKGDANADSFTIDLKVTFDSAQNADNSRFASVFVCNTIDYPFSDSATLSTNEVGYHLLMRKSGSVQIYKRTDTASATLLANQSLPIQAIADGEEAIYRVEVTPSSITISRLDGSGNVMTSATTNDTTYRGGYFWLGRNGLACRFRNIVIT